MDYEKPLTDEELAELEEHAKGGAARGFGGLILQAVAELRRIRAPLGIPRHIWEALASADPKVRAAAQERIERARTGMARAVDVATKNFDAVERTLNEKP